MKKITDKGLGNGTSLIIMIGILARLPQSFLQELSAKSVRNGQILVFIIEIAILIAIIMGCILLIQGVRKVPVNYAKQIVGNRQFGGARKQCRTKHSENKCREPTQSLDHIPSKFGQWHRFSHDTMRALRGGVVDFRRPKKINRRPAKPDGGVIETEKNAISIRAKLRSFPKRSRTIHQSPSRQRY